MFGVGGVVLMCYGSGVVLECWCCGVVVRCVVLWLYRCYGVVFGIGVIWCGVDGGAIMILVMAV